MTTDNLGAIINYVNYEAQQLTSESKTILKSIPLSDETKTSVVIPVFNEGGEFKTANISRTINSLIAQTNLQGDRIHQYEIIAVNNNSTDNTLEILLDFSTSADIPILIINEVEKGYENALKAGLDFVTRRFLEREIRHGSLETGKIKFQNFSLVTTDADPTEISKLWIYRIQELMNNEKIDCFGGPMPLSIEDSIKYPNINLIIERYTVLTKKLWNIFGGQTPGANMGMRPYWYSLIGGVKKVFNLPYAMDVFMGDKIMTLGGKAEMLPDDGFVCFNLRRVLDNPIKWFAGKTYDEGMKIIRDENTKGDLPKEMIEEAWRIRKQNTVNLLLQLILLKPFVLFEKEKIIIPLFDSVSAFETFKNTVRQLGNTQIFEAQKFLSENYFEQIERNI